MKATLFSKRVISSIEEFYDLEAVWQGLSANNSELSLFNSFAWNESWIRCYWTNYYELNVVIIESSNQVVAILPLYRNKKEKSLLFLATGEPEFSEVSSEYLDFIVEAEKKDELYQYIADYLVACDVSYIGFVNCASGSHVLSVSALIPMKVVVKTGRKFRMKLSSEFDSNNVGVSIRQKKNNRQLLNRFENVDELSCEVYKIDEYAKRWEALKGLHQKDWKSRGCDGALISREFNDFHQYMHDNYQEITQLFSSLSFDGEVISIHHYYKYKNILYFYLTGTLKSTHRRLSPGMMLHLLCLANLTGEETCYDFMKGGSQASYKEKFCEAEGGFYSITIFCAGLVGRASFYRYKFLAWLKSIKRVFFAAR